MKKIIVLFIGYVLIGCSIESPTKFSKEALEDVFFSKEQEEVTFQEILDKQKGKKFLIDVWASWCKDCLEGLPDVRKLQKANVEVVFLSLDRNITSWKEGIDRLKLEGEHYFMQSGWEGSFGKFLGLNWIPRYLVIDESGEIIVFNATKATDKRIIEALKK